MSKRTSRFISLIIILGILTAFIGSKMPVFADTPQTAMLMDTFRFRTEPSTSSSIISDLPPRTVVTILATVKGAYVAGYGDDWYQITYNGRMGYIIKHSDVVVYSDSDTESFSAHLRTLGFPDSYIPGLVSLHLLHPSWVFRPLFTNRDWNYVLDMQEGKNAVHARYPISQYSSLTTTVNGGYGPSYVPLWDIHRFKDGTSFYFASRNTIAYYLDPRNFFVDVPSAYMDNLKNLGSIFMFSSNAYFENQDGNVTNKILAGTFLSRERTSTVTYKDQTGATIITDKSYIDMIMDASTYSGAGAYFIATRMKMEITVGGEPSSAVWCDHPDRDIFDPTGIYDGIYNFYNIYASDSSTPYQNIINGLYFAKNGFKTDYPTDTSDPTVNDNNARRNATNLSLNNEYLLPWTSPERAIKGGARYLAKNYILAGQHTLYLQKWDVNPSSSTFTTHQYMSSVHAPAGESYGLAISYRDLGLLNEAFVFDIPVYQNMPSAPVSIASETRSANNLIASLGIRAGGVELVSNFDPLNAEPIVVYVDANVESVTIFGRKAGFRSTLMVNGRTDGIESIRLPEESPEGNPLINPSNPSYFVIKDQPARGFSFSSGPLAMGNNIFVISNTSETGETRDYVVHVRRGEVLINRGSYRITDGSYLTGIQPGTTVEQIKQNVFADGCNTFVYAPDASEATQTVGTGFLVRVKKDNTVLSDEIVIIYGDINGDGNINAIDTTMARRTSISTMQLTPTQFKAADSNRDSSVNAIDVTMSRRHTMGTYTIEQ